MVVQLRSTGLVRAQGLVQRHRCAEPKAASSHGASKRLGTTLRLIQRSDLDISTTGLGHGSLRRRSDGAPRTLWLTLWWLTLRWLTLRALPLGPPVIRRLVHAAYVRRIHPPTSGVFFVGASFRQAVGSERVAAR